MNIRDVIHGDIGIEEEVVKQLIETKEFQRLRNIKQLGLTYLAFPTTEHSRFYALSWCILFSYSIIRCFRSKNRTSF